MDGMKVLVQANMPISRPDDFLAEMLKTDKHMVNVKSRFLQQQVKIKTFEEKKQKAENKKFHKAIKDFKMKQKHQDKKDTSNAIIKFKARDK
jgi:rRNA-processing protein EBP2